MVALKLEISRPLMTTLERLGDEAPIDEVCVALLEDGIAATLGEMPISGVLFRSEPAKPTNRTAPASSASQRVGRRVPRRWNHRRESMPPAVCSWSKG